MCSVSGQATQSSQSRFGGGPPISAWITRKLHTKSAAFKGAKYFARRPVDRRGITFFSEGHDCGYFVFKVPYRNGTQL